MTFEFGIIHLGILNSAFVFCLSCFGLVLYLSIFCFIPHYRIFKNLISGVLSLCFIIIVVALQQAFSLLLRIWQSLYFAFSFTSYLWKLCSSSYDLLISYLSCVSCNCSVGDELDFSWRFFCLHLWLPAFRCDMSGCAYFCMHCTGNPMSFPNVQMISFLLLKIWHVSAVVSFSISSSPFPLSFWCFHYVWVDVLMCPGVLKLLQLHNHCWLTLKVTGSSLEQLQPTNPLLSSARNFFILLIVILSSKISPDSLVYVTSLSPSFLSPYLVTYVRVCVCVYVLVHTCVCFFCQCVCACTYMCEHICINLHM